MGHGQVAAQYRRLAEACILRAGRGTNSAEWIQLSREWEELARVRDSLAAESNDLPTEEDGRPDADRT